MVKLVLVFSGDPWLGLGPGRFHLRLLPLTNCSATEKYNLRILTHLDNPEDLKFSGVAQIELEAVQNTKNITLHSKSLLIDASKITLTQVNGEKKDNCITSTEVNSVQDFYILNACQELEAGNVYQLTLPFEAELNKQLQGYYRSSYQIPETNETKWVNTLLDFDC